VEEGASFRDVVPEETPHAGAVDILTETSGPSEQVHTSMMLFDHAEGFTQRMLT
jgi:hypothetical protein